MGWSNQYVIICVECISMNGLNPISISVKRFDKLDQNNKSISILLKFNKESHNKDTLK